MSKSQSEETGGTVVDTDPRNNFLALKLALAIKTGDGDQFCEAYDNRGLSGLNKQEFDWIKEQARKDSVLPVMTLKARMGWYKDMVIPDFVRKLEENVAFKKAPDIGPELQKEAALMREEADYQEGRKRVKNAVEGMIGTASPNKDDLKFGKAGSDKNQNYTRKAMTELNDRETRAELFQNYHKEENFDVMNALSMRKKNSHVKLDIPSQVDDPITFGLGGSSCCVEETPVEVEPVPTKPKNRRKQKKPSRREPSIKDAGPRPAEVQTNRGKLEAGDGPSEAVELALSAVEKPRDYGTMDNAEPVVEKDERKPKKRTIKQFKEEKERERQNVNIRPQFLVSPNNAEHPFWLIQPPAATQATEPKPKDKKLLQRDEARKRELLNLKYQIPDWVEEEDKKEKTKKQAQGNKGKAKKGKKKEQVKQAAKQEKQEKPQSVKKENSVETNSLSDTSEYAQLTPKAEAVKSERRKSHEFIDERSLLYDDDEWATIGVSKPTRSERRSVPSDSRANEPKRSPPTRSPPNLQQPRFPLQNNRVTSIENQKQETLSRPARQKTPDIKVNSTQDWPGLPPSNKGDAPKLLPPLAHRPGTRYEQRQASKAARASAQAAAAAAEAARDAAAEKARAARIEAEKAEAARNELAKLEAAQAERARIVAEKAEAMRRQAEQARIQAEEARIKAAKAEAETARIQAVKEATETARLESERAAAVKADALRSSVFSARATPPPSKAPSARKGKLRQERNQEREKSTESDIMENILGDQMGLNFFTAPCEDLPDEEKEFPVFSNAQAEEESWPDEPVMQEERASSSNEMRLDSEQIRQMLLKFNAKARTYPAMTQPHEKIVQFHNKKYQKLLAKHKNGCRKTVIYSS